MKYYKFTSGNNVWAVRSDGMERCVVVDNEIDDYHKQWHYPEDYNEDIMEVYVESGEAIEITKKEAFLEAL